MNNFISIIVPVYNVPYAMLRKCLNSLQDLNYKDYEVIVIDDGSTDDSSKIVDEYKKNKKFKIFHKQNGGLCDARNYGQKQAIGKWICFVDGDDYLEKDTFTNVIPCVKDDAEIICFGTIKEYKTKKFKYDYNNAFEENIIYKNNIELLTKLLDFKTNVGDVTGKLYDRFFLKNNNIEHDKNVRQGVEAIDFNFRCFESTKGFQFIKYYGYNYAYNSQSITFKMDKRTMELLLLGIDKLYLDIENSKYEKELKDVLNTRTNIVVVTTLISGIFSPYNKISKIEIEELINMMNENSNIRGALQNKSNLDITRKLIIVLYKCKLYLFIKIISIMRNIQKEI